MNAIQILLIILIGLFVNSCSAKNVVVYSDNNTKIARLDTVKIDNTIKILFVDSLKFVNYYTCEFEANKNITGYLLINKSKINSISLDLLILEKIKFNNLCDVVEFQTNDSEITFRGHAILNGIYEDDELVIDLSNDIEKRYYQLCDINKFKIK